MEIWLHSKNSGNFNLIPWHLHRQKQQKDRSNTTTSAHSMGGIDAESGASSPYEDEEYADGDFEEQDGVPGDKQTHSLAAAGQVHPLDPVDSDTVKSVAVKVTGAVRTAGDEDEDGADNSDEYSDDDFEGEKIAPSVAKAALSTTLTETQQQAKSDGGDAAPGAPVKYSRAYDDFDDNGDDGDALLEFSVDPEQQDAAHRVATAARSAVELVTIHAYRTPETVLIPPAPAYRPSSQQNPITKCQQQELRLSEKRASVAAKRVQEYQDIQAQRKAQQAAETAASKKKREQFRASNRKVYEQMGVNKLTGEQLYQLLVEEKRLLKQHRAASVQLEKHQRWYNAKAAEPNRKNLALVHVAELQEQYRGRCLQRHRDTVQRSQVIKANQAELHRQAQAIAAKCTQTQYTRGSYLLKTTTTKSKQPLKTNSKSVPLAHEINNKTNTPQSRPAPEPAEAEVECEVEPASAATAEAPATEAVLIAEIEAESEAGTGIAG